MTLILKSDATLSSPTFGAFLPPNLGVSNVLARYNALSLPGALGAAITAIPDLTIGGYGFGLSLVSGSAAINVRSGTKTMSLAAGAVLQSAAFSGVAFPRTLALACYFVGSPPSTTLPLFASLVGPVGQIAMEQTGLLAAYGTGGSFPQTYPIAEPGWYRVIATLDPVGNVANIVVNGATVSGGCTMTGTIATQMTLQSTSAVAMEVVDAALIGHVCTTGEIAAIDAALHALLPV